MPNYKYPGKKNAKKIMAAADKAMKKSFKSKTKGGPSEEEKAKAYDHQDQTVPSKAKTSAGNYGVGSVSKMAKK
tara:strand:- start:585 stop:806 length:222 start_codon:yes stop_codon:yes gene_type:complete